MARALSIRGIPDPILRNLRQRAATNRRSLNSELLVILQEAVASPGPTPARVRETAEPPYAAGGTSSSNRRDLLKVERRMLAALCRRHHIERLAVFGSVARGEAQPESDVDVVVDFEPGMTPGLGIVAVADALTPVFGGRRVDLVTRRGLRPRLRDRILEESVVLYGS